MKFASVFLPCFFLVLFTACSTQPQGGTAMADTRAADEAAIRAQDANWLKATSSKDVPTIVSFWSNNASVFMPGQPVASGRDAIQAMVAATIADPNFALTFAPSHIEVARSGDIAYEIGDYQLTMSDQKKKPQTVKAKYIVVWTKDANGAWKSIVDAPTTSQ